MVRVNKARQAPAPGQQLTLDKLPLNCRAKVVSINGRDDDPISQRLADLGFLAGTEVVGLRRAPVGEPTIFLLRNYQMCLRRAETDRIVVEVLASESSED